jgi:hypothetical protein
MRLAFLLFVGSIVVSAWQAPPRDAGTVAAPTGTGSISGVIKDETNHPLRRATVTVTHEGRLTLTSITDDEGRFVFANLPTGRFTIGASKPAYPSASYGASRPNRLGAGILLAEGQQVTGLVLTLPRGGVLAGAVFDDHGRRMPGVPVMAWEVRTSLAGDRTLDFPATGGEAVTSDDRGEYRLFGLPPGEYTVGTAWFFSGSTSTRVPSDAEIRAAFESVKQPVDPNHPPAPDRPSPPLFNYTRVFYPSAIDPLSAGTVHLAAGEERDGLDLHMQFVTMSRIEGTVVGPAGPIGGAQMSLVRRSPVQALNSTTFWSNSRDGRFTSPSLGPGEYTIQARTTPSAGQPAQWASTDVTVSGADPVVVTLRLESALTLSGRITFDDAATTPRLDLSRIALLLISSQRNASPNPGSSVVDPSGSFSIADVVPGSYRMSVRLPPAAGSGSSPWTVLSITSGGRDVTDVPIDVSASAVPALVVTLTDQVSDLSGTLSDASGQPITDYFIIALPADRKYWLPGSRRIVSTRPDVRGHYAFHALPPGDYRIAATTDLVQSDLSDPNALALLLAQSAPLTIGPGEKKTFDLKVGR